MINNDLARKLYLIDKILSENYLQHADHFTRILNEKESFKRERFSENKHLNKSDIVEENIEDSEIGPDKNLANPASEENKIEESKKTQVETI